MKLKIAMVQFNPTVGDVMGNADRILMFAREAAQRDGVVAVVFTELALTGYPPEDLLLRPDFLQVAARELDRIRQQAPEIVLVLGYPEWDQGVRYNSVAILQRGQWLANYRKQVLPNFGVFDEKRYFEAGDQPCVFDLQGIQVGISLCEDIWSPQPCQRLKQAGAQLILNLNASPFHAGKIAQREAVLRDRVAETGLPIVYVNQVGGQDELVFDGASFVMNSAGEVVQRVEEFAESLAVVEFDVAAAPVPIEAPGPQPMLRVASIYQAIVLGIRDYVRKHGFQGAVLGLSGGVDSALVLALAVDALGADAVQVVLMPSQYTADMSNEDAVAEAKALGVAYETIPIRPAFEAFKQMLASSFEGLGNDVTEENLQARCRGVLLMAISNKKRRILLTTGNKSEMSVGYATLYGDMAGGFAPIKDVPKMLVYELCRHRNQIAPVIPERVLTRPPSAELAPDQKDEDSLPPYPILDDILERYVERDQSQEDIIAAGHSAETVKRVLKLVEQNEYKRRQAPPGVKITGRAFGRDRRYPITSGFSRIWLD